MQMTGVALSFVLCRCVRSPSFGTADRVRSRQLRLRLRSSKESILREPNLWFRPCIRIFTIGVWYFTSHHSMQPLSPLILVFMSCQCSILLAGARSCHWGGFGLAATWSRFYIRSDKVGNHTKECSKRGKVQTRMNEIGQRSRKTSARFDTYSTYCTDYGNTPNNVILHMLEDVWRCIFVL